MKWWWWMIWWNCTQLTQGTTRKVNGNNGNGHNVPIYVAYRHKPKTTSIVTDSFPTSPSLNDSPLIVPDFYNNHRKGVAQKLTRAESAGLSPHPLNIPLHILRCVVCFCVLNYSSFSVFSCPSRWLGTTHQYWTTTVLLRINKRISFSKGYRTTTNLTGMTTATSFNIDILFFAISLLAFVLVFIPLPWHLKG